MSRLSKPAFAADAEDIDRGADEPLCPSHKRPDEPHPHEGRNFLVLAMQQLLLRVGWIFKTESVVMPYFLAVVGGSPTMLGWMMVLNRFGFSVPPILAARWVKLSPRKSRSIAMTSFGMAIPFALLSTVWASGAWRGADGEPAGWMPYLFLTAYGVFFALTGVNQLAMHAATGKLIRPTLRGRLFSASVFVGAPAAIALAWWLMPGWLAKDDGGFGWIFAAPAVAFALSAAAMLLVRERRDDYTEPASNPWEKLSGAWRLLRDGPRFHGAAITALLYSTTFMLFPHYQALAREGVESFDPRSLLGWLVGQHVAVALFSLLVGPLADRRGNRAALRLTVWGSILAPIIAVVLATLGAEAAEGWYWLVFVPLGFTPVSIKLLMNYALELTEPENHPMLLSAIGACLAAPVLVGAPLVGWIIGLVGCTPVFVAGAAVLAVAGVQTLRLEEPRHTASEEASE
ncbi:Major Facilitator Superfamily protein [Pseudobythopirellula maris]|uniref:Major Facilitator Superfamily protein n=1 Tax=Pseudobythopirellula maris TaxID=2527991 RepID=A0A5C5ZI56_9BACT|nr:MFS transporter [Pseudobythopirellula maris]TWT86868.1 Major Facilitator Superfamily protein [Pseudobythopirellula maris]